MSGPPPPGRRTYRVHHRTTYEYDSPVTDSYGLAHVRPRDLDWQTCHEHAFVVDPEPQDASSAPDYYGNTRAFFHLTEPHTRLEVAATSVVDVRAQQHDAAALAQPWERCRPADRPDVDDAWRARDLVLGSPRVELVDEATAYARVSFTPGRPVGEALTELCSRVHDDFAYDTTATTVTSRVPDVLARRAGVCQDFAHLTVAGLRGLGLAARYVSGYLATTPPPGRKRVVGADASHAWAACWVPGTGWAAIDPTNDAWADERYVTVGWGRDYGDVPPVKGVIFSDGGGSRLDVGVDVAPLDDEAPRPSGTGPSAHLGLHA
ncbi:transglutaminase family protein [Solicola sp. PLA-1-18]|uniref:transglutaminase family protein n=1 Tax=Solicola sp. PLA-1-18 TaxID=3380532 RepID=UPI003B7B0857